MQSYSRIEASSSYNNFRIHPRQSPEGISLEEDSRVFREQTKQFLESVLTIEKIALLYDVVRDPASHESLQKKLKFYFDKNEDEWKESEDRAPFESAKCDLKKIESKKAHGQICLTIRPYSHFLDVICLQISHKLRSINEDLNKIGITIPQSTFHKLSEGASHEAFHYLRYLSFDNTETIHGRLDLLNNGTSKLDQYVHHNIELTFLLVDGQLDFEMFCQLPQGFSLEEQVQIYLAPINPSVGDAIHACSEVIRQCNPQHPLYSEVQTLILDIMDEVFPRKDISVEEHHQMIISSIKGLDFDWYFHNVLYPKFKPLGEAFTGEVIKRIGQYIPKDFGLK